jgi:RNA polymerase sigma factor (sigma-70 family)
MKFLHSEPNEQQLIADALGGSKTALELLLKTHYSFIYNVALRFVLNPVEAEDLTQEVIIKVITKLSQYNHQSKFSTWLYRIVFHHFINSKRGKLEHALVSFDAYGNALDQIPDLPLSSIEEEKFKEQVEDAKIGCMTGMLLCLSREQRLIFVLGEIFEIDSKTGSELLEISMENFRQLLSRARKDLYQFMHNKCGLINAQNPCRCPKKTKGFIQAGWVNETSLQFNTDFVKRISEIASLKANQCDDLLEEKYGSLFKDHPYYDRDQTAALIHQLTSDKEFKSIFNL